MDIQKTKAKTNRQTNNNNKEFKTSSRDPARFLFTSSHLACEQQTYFLSSLLQPKVRLLFAGYFPPS